MKDNYGKTIGIIGGGQLGRMMSYTANVLGFKTVVYSDSNNVQGSSFESKLIVGSYEDVVNVLRFTDKCDFITTELENLPHDTLRAIEVTYPNKLNPNSLAIYTTQNRLREKQFAASLNIPVPNFAEIANHNDAQEFYQNHSNGFILKTASSGYDGKGQYRVKSYDDIPRDLESWTYIAEETIDFDFEFSVILTRSVNGRIVFFPSPINFHKDGILISSEIKHATNQSTFAIRGMDYSKKIADTLNYVGTMAVEFFCTKNGDVLFNEIAPRPHNSAHYTMDLCNVCQFQNHIRAITGIDIIEPLLLFDGKMINLIGPESLSIADTYVNNINAKIHFYGKSPFLKNRKMGHVTYRL